MKSHMIMVVALLCLLPLGFEPSNGARLVKKNDLHIGRDNPCVFDRKLTSVVANARSASKNAAEKTGLLCYEDEIKRWAFRLRGDTKNQPLNPEEVVYVIPVDKATPSRASYSNGRRLSKSAHSPGVGHMQVYRTANSRQSGGVVGMQQQQRDGTKRILESTPSPGAGH